MDIPKMVTISTGQGTLGFIDSSTCVKAVIIAAT